MKKFLTKDNLITFLIGVIAVLLLIIVSFIVYEKNFADTNRKDSNTNTTIEVTPTPTTKPAPSEPEKNESVVTPSVPQKTPEPTPAPTPVPTQKPVVLPTPTPEENYTEEDIVSFFTTNEANLEANKNNVNFKEKAKEYFVTVVDFIFYGSEIKGYTFKELTTTAKLKIIKLALSIDNKIDSYFPNYKESIKAGYQSVKASLLKLYLETMNKLCEKVGDASCNQAKSDFQDMKASFGFTFDLLLEAGGDLKTAIAEWYKNFKAN